jgi:hypothetical protein
MILALDLATRTGWAVGRPSDKPKSGSVKFGNSDSSTGARCRAYHQWLGDMIAVHGIELVVMEKPQPPSFHVGATTLATMRYLIGMVEHTEEFCYDRVELREASVSDIRNHFIGGNPRGKDGKAQVQSKCTQLGWQWDDDNAADALAAWQYMSSILVPKLAVRASPLFYGKRRIVSDF